MRTTPPAWWLMAGLATAIALYAFRLAWVGLDAFDNTLARSFARHPWAIWSHMAIGGLALVTGALNFRHDLRRARPRIHHRIGLTYVVSALLAGGLAGGYLAFFAMGGLPNRLGFGGLALATTVCTLAAWRFAIVRDFARHWAWIVRSYAMILAAVTLRIELPLLVIAFRGDFPAAYAIVAWLCWVPNLLVAEWIVRRTPKAPI